MNGLDLFSSLFLLLIEEPKAKIIQIMHIIDRLPTFCKKYPPATGYCIPVRSFPSFSHPARTVRPLSSSVVADARRTWGEHGAEDATGCVRRGSVSMTLGALLQPHGHARAPPPSCGRDFHHGLSSPRPPASPRQEEELL